MEGARFMMHAETATHYLPIASDDSSTTWEIECVGGHLLYVNLDYEDEYFFVDWRGNNPDELTNCPYVTQNVTYFFIEM